MNLDETWIRCPECGSKNVKRTYWQDAMNDGLRCLDCDASGVTKTKREIDRYK